MSPASPSSFGGVQALQRVTFRVEPGRIVGVMGPNGAGKTTLFNLITGVYRPSAGIIRFGDRELQGLHAVAHLPFGHCPHLSERPPVQRT